MEFDDIKVSNENSINNGYPLIMLTHSEFNYSLFKFKKIIFLIRSPLDVIVSYYFHNKKHHNRYEGSIQTFVRDSVYGIKKWIKYINSWSDYLINSNAIIISYEQLHSSTQSILIDIIEYLGILVDLDCLQKAITLSKFDNMAKVEIKDEIKGHVYDKSDIESRRMRKGKIGGYYDYLDNEDVGYINASCKRYLMNESKELLDSVVIN